VIKDAKDTYRVWAADPHQFGPGKIHLIDDRDETKTLCGRPLSSFPGRPVSNGQPTCKVCIEAPERRRQADEQRAQWARESAERARLEYEANAEWWREYDEYLQTPQWRALRAEVLRRANGVCAGCPTGKPTQVHHLTYKHVRNEFLWELEAVCERCHQRVHADRQ
jgi:5-methylcytosine-specific restriction endonuclease McrA